MTNELIEKVAHYLAEFDGNLYWKNNAIPENEKFHVEEWYVGNAKRYIGMVELIMEHKKNE